MAMMMHRWAFDLQAEQAALLCDWVLALLRGYSAAHKGLTGVQVGLLRIVGSLVVRAKWTKLIGWHVSVWCSQPSRHALESAPSIAAPASVIRSRAVKVRCCSVINPPTMWMHAGIQRSAEGGSGGGGARAARAAAAADQPHAARPAGLWQLTRRPTSGCCTG